MERGEVAGVREGRPELGGSLRVEPQSAVGRSMLRLRLAPKTSHTVAQAVASNIRRHCLRQMLQLSMSGHPTAL